MRSNEDWCRLGVVLSQNVRAILQKSIDNVNVTLLCSPMQGGSILAIDGVDELLLSGALVLVSLKYHFYHFVVALV